MRQFAMMRGLGYSYREVAEGNARVQKGGALGRRP
jgi:hypothetical protein